MEIKEPHSKVDVFSSFYAYLKAGKSELEVAGLYDKELKKHLEPLLKFVEEEIDIHSYDLNVRPPKKISIRDIFQDSEDWSDISIMECVKPTKTLTKGKLYEVISLRDRWRPTWYGDYDTYRDMIGVINDKGSYIEVSEDRFEKSKML